MSAAQHHRWVPVDEVMRLPIEPYTEPAIRAYLAQQAKVCCIEDFVGGMLAHGCGVFKDNWNYPLTTIRNAHRQWGRTVID